MAERRLVRAGVRSSTSRSATPEGRRRSATIARCPSTGCGRRWKAFAIDKRKHELEPGNTTYRRDLSISYERLADLAREAGELEVARDFVERAVHIRRAVQRLEPHRVDVAVELAYTLYSCALIAVVEARENAGQAERKEIMEVLVPFEAAGLLTLRGQGLLAWAREEDSDQPDAQ